jgi:hypothetical protein
MIVTKATDESKEMVVTNHDQKSLEEMRLNAKYAWALLFVITICQLVSLVSTWIVHNSTAIENCGICATACVASTCVRWAIKDHAEHYSRHAWQEAQGSSHDAEAYRHYPRTQGLLQFPTDNIERHQGVLEVLLLMIAAVTVEWS